MKKALLALTVLMLITIIACAQPASGMVIRSDKERVSTPAAGQPDITTVVQGNSTFALDLYQVLKKTSGNLLYSPYSISAALAMTYAGARTETEKQMADTLRFTLPQERLHPTFNTIDLELARRGQGAKGKDGKEFRLHSVNAIWGQKGYSFQAAFLDTLAQSYGAGLRIVDFVTATEQSRQTINTWVSDQTEARIKDLIPRGALDQLTRLVLTNAVYFNAAWQNPFKTEATKDGPFYLLDTTTVTVPMMRQTASFGYAEDDDYQAVDLPYDGRELSMTVILPRTGKFESWENNLSFPRIADIVKKLGYKQVNLTMPRFQFESDFRLSNALATMGMPVAFSDQADFSGMTGNRELHIADVIHKTFIELDEAGTEAAAATAVIMAATSMPQQPISVTLDHPFIFLIRDGKTGTILFVGRLANPAK